VVARWLCIALLPWLGACRTDTAAQARTETLFVFGTLVEIQWREHDDQARAETAIAAIGLRLSALERDWHPWQESALTRINAALARGEAAEASPSVLDLIAQARPWMERSGNRFDPGIGALIALWGFHTSEWPVHAPPPDDAAIAALVDTHPSLADVHVEGTRVRSDKRTVQLDFNAIAEGAASAEIAALLRAHGINDALINFGGDVYALGDAGGRPWRVALRGEADRVLALVDLADGEALFASGAYAKFREEPSGGRGPHVLDPHDGRPVRGVLTTAVLTRNPIQADAAATALMVAGTSAWSHTAGAMGVNCALLIDEHGAAWLTTAMAARVQWQGAPPPQTQTNLGPACL
jgi:thiamine biosynthesis lipoprotein